MSAYRDALSISSDTEGPRRELALEVLASKGGVVLVDERVALRPIEDSVLCEVITRLPEESRSDSAMREEINAAQDLLASSTLADVMKRSSLTWLVVDDYGSGTIQLWPREG